MPAFPGPQAFLPPDPVKSTGVILSEQGNESSKSLSTAPEVRHRWCPGVIPPAARKQNKALRGERVKRKKRNY